MWLAARIEQETQIKEICRNPSLPLCCLCQESLLFVQFLSSLMLISVIVHRFDKTVTLCNIMSSLLLIDNFIYFIHHVFYSKWPKLTLKWQNFAVSYKKSNSYNNLSCPPEKYLFNSLALGLVKPNIYLPN